LDDDATLQDISLYLRQGEEELLQQKFMVFSPIVDMENHVFKRGLVFSIVEELSETLNA
jgi:hypothetical protein